MVISGKYTVKRDRAGEAGTAFAQGLAESVPKAVDRYRLSQGLKNIQNQNGSPIDQLSTLYQSGASPEQINQIMPYLRNAAIAGKKPTNPNSPYGELRQPQPTNETIELHEKEPGFGETFKPQLKRQEPSIVTPQGESAARAPARIPHPDEVDRRTRELMNNYPELYQGENAYPNAYARASEELNYPTKVQHEQQAANTRQEDQATRTANKLLDKTSKKLQKDPKEMFSIIPGEAYERAENRVKLATAQGTSSDKATDIESDYLKNLGKNINTLRNNIASRPFFGKVTDQTKKDVANLKPFFEKNGELELFKDEQKSALDIGDHLASVNTWEASKPQQTIISKITSKDTPEQIAARLYPTIDDKTSLFTLGYLVNKVGGDDQAVINELVKLDQGLNNNFNERQTREGSEYYPLTPQMGDLFYTAFFGLPYLAGKSLLDYVTGKKEKTGTIENIKRSFGKE